MIETMEYSFDNVSSYWATTILTNHIYKIMALVAVFCLKEIKYDIGRVPAMGDQFSV